MTCLFYVYALRCAYEKKCSPYKDYLKINGNDDLKVKGICLNNCNEVKNLKYHYNVYEYMPVITVQGSLQEAWILYSNITYHATQVDLELTLRASLFNENAKQSIWKIELEVLVESLVKPASFVSSSIIVYVNQPPYRGSCTCYPNNGTSNTLYTLNCDGWLDSDGSVAKYSFYGREKQYLQSLRDINTCQN